MALESRAAKDECPLFILLVLLSFGERKEFTNMEQVREISHDADLPRDNRAVWALTHRYDYQISPTFYCFDSTGENGVIIPVRAADCL